MVGRGTGRRKPWQKKRETVAPGLGDRVRDLRETLGLTQDQLGAGVLTGSYISEIERGNARPSRAALAHIANQLGTTVVVLGAVGSHPSADAFAALTQALALVRAASQSGTAREQRLLGHAEWLLAGLIADLGENDDPPDTQQHPD